MWQSPTCEHQVIMKRQVYLLSLKIKLVCVAYVLAGVPYRDLPASDLLALNALVLPLSLPFGRLPRRLMMMMMIKTAQNGEIGQKDNRNQAR